MRSAVVAIVTLVLACACAGTETEPEPQPECCTVDELIALTVAGVPAATLVDTLRVSSVVVPSDPATVARLQQNSVDPSVIAVITGPACECPIRVVPAAPPELARPDVIPCCTADWAIARTQHQVPVTRSLHDAMMKGANEALSASDLERMNAAGVPAELVHTLNGGPCACGADVSSDASTPSGPPPLQIQVKDPGGRRFEVMNLSNREYTNVTITVNDEYVYSLRKLKERAGDSISVGSFTSKKNGSELKKGEMKRMYIRSDQGVWSGTF